MFSNTIGVCVYVCMCVRRNERKRERERERERGRRGKMERSLVLCMAGGRIYKRHGCGMKEQGQGHRPIVDKMIKLLTRSALIDSLWSLRSVKMHGYVEVEIK